jgi:sugar lactone lactonase YvrE
VLTLQSNAATSEYTDAGTGTCGTAASTPAATVCTVDVKFTPAAAGIREGSATTNSATGPLASEPLIGIGSASKLTIDPATTTNLGSSILPLGVSTDELGNVYLSDGTGQQVLRTTISGGSPSPVITGLSKPTATATDAFGNLYVADATSNSIVMRTPSGTTSTVVSGLNAPQGLAPAPLGGVYVADTGNNRILLYSMLAGTFTNFSVYPLTLSSPTGLAVDEAGNLFIVDSGNQRVVELPAADSPKVVTLSQGIVPAAIAIDAAGSLYVADSASGTVQQLAPSGAATTLTSGLTSVVGLAADASGNVFLADTSRTSATALNRSQSSATLASTTVGDTSLPATFTLSNAGNASLTLGTPLFMETGSTAVFPAGTPASCTASLTLASTNTCTQSFVFQPTATGTQTVMATFTPTAGSSVVANLSAAGNNLIHTSLTPTQTTPASGNVNYGQALTYTVTLIPQSNAGNAPTGTIVLNVDGKQTASMTVSSNPYTFNLNLPVGLHAVSAAYSGDADYGSSNASTSITVNKAVTTITSSYQQTATGITLNATVVAATTGQFSFTGNVDFYIDGNIVNTFPVGNGNVGTSVVLQDGSHTFYAAYNGDGNYAASSSTAQTLTLARTVTATSLTVTLSAAGTGLTFSAQVKPASGTAIPTGSVVFTNGTKILGTATLSASGLATITTTTTAYSSLSFSASYSGDGFFQPSVGSDAGFYAVPPAAAVGVPDGTQVITNISIVPVNGYTGTLTPSCSNLPANAQCRFLPTTVTLAGATSTVLQVELFAGVNPSVGMQRSLPLIPGSRVALALLLAAPFLYRSRRKLRSRVLPLILVMVGAFLLPLGLTGCGNSLKIPAATNAVYSTLAGTYPVTLNLTDTNGLKRSAVINITVTQ